METDLPNLTTWLLAAVLAMTALAAGVVVVSRLAVKRILKEQEARRLTEREHQRQLLANSIEVQERERQRIAADLHDEVASRLQVVKLNLHHHRHEPASEQEEQNLALVSEVIATSRRISHDLFPPHLEELGLGAVLDDYLQPLKNRLAVKFVFTGRIAHRPLPARELQLYRLVNELVQNVLKHSNASALTVHLRMGSELTALLVEDNGCGFEPEKVKTGLGIKTLESRTQVLGGRYRLKTAPNKGTNFLLVVPKTTPP